MPVLSIDGAVEEWPLARTFVIARGARATARVVVATVSDGQVSGRGECVPYARYGQSPDDTLGAIRSASVRDRAQLQAALPANAARNALDCALWDLEAKRAGRSAAALAGRPQLAPVATCYTLSLDEPAAMAEAARSVPHLPLLKLKLGRRAGDHERMRAVRRARPDARLLADANEGWRAEELPALLATAAEAGIELIEQPLPDGRDEALAQIERPVPVCADESAHTASGLARLRGRYDAVNIKLDKAGGLTEALLMAAEARRLGFRIMVGSMLATSLSMAPALIVAQGADWVDLDSPLLLARDREFGLAVRDGTIAPPDPRLWG